MTDKPEPLPKRTPGATFTHQPPATTQAPKTPTGWDDPWGRPNAWEAFSSDTQEQQ